ncbi:MAG: apolipoprotein N-acyltransferase [Gammaproteobacteria bacterium]|nr:apolipoprotein N-acyltransferase [Gammaproteobacteria bacterium]
MSRSARPEQVMLNQRWSYRLIALTAGVLLSQAFAPLAIYPLAVVMPAVLFYLWLQLDRKEAAWLGFFFGMGLFGVGMSWVYVAIHVFGHTPPVVAAILTFLFAVYLSLFPALQGYVSARLLEHYRQRETFERWALLLILPMLWLLFEWIRGWFLTGMPWLHLGYSHIDSPLSGLAPVLGVYGVSAISVFSSGVLLLLWQQKNIRIKAASILIVIWGVAALLGQMNWTQEIDKPIRVSIVQGNVPQITKWDPAKIQLRLDTYERLTRANWDTDLIFWPENSISMFYHDLKHRYFRPLEKEAQENNVELIVGLPYMNLKTREYYSSLLSLGKTPGVYHKRHLVPFGEYVPLGFLIRGLVQFFDLPMSSFSAGEKDQQGLKAVGQLMAPSICYEDSFGEEVLDFLPQATLLINGSNNAWYGDSLAPHQHLQISRMRALETGRMLIRGTTNGISAIVDHRGEVVSRSPQFKEFVLKGEVQPRTGSTPYVRMGNWPVIMVMFLIGLFLAFDIRRQK